MIDFERPWYPRNVRRLGPFAADCSGTTQARRSNKWARRIRHATLTPILTLSALVWLVAASPDPVNRGSWGVVVEQARGLTHSLGIPAGAPVFPGKRSGYHTTLVCNRILGRRFDGDFEQLWISFPGCVPPSVRPRESAERTLVHRTIANERRSGVNGLSTWACADHLRRTGAPLDEVWIVRRVDRQHFSSGRRKQSVDTLVRFDCQARERRFRATHMPFIDPTGIPRLK